MKGIPFAKAYYNYLSGLAFSTYKNSVFILFCHNYDASYNFSIINFPIVQTRTSVLFYLLVFYFASKIANILSRPNVPPTDGTYSNFKFI